MQDQRCLSFIGRKAELRFLQNAWKSGRSQLIPIYGRRRVGKSKLIGEFIAGKRAIYLAGKKNLARAHLQELMEVAAQTFGQESLHQTSPKDWRHALQILHEHNRGAPLVLALDEFQWLVEAAPELPSVLQEFWDRDWEHGKPIFLILCGSYIGFMEREVLGSKSPLFGRRTGQIQLRPFNFQSARHFLPHYSITAQAQAYFVCGGIPLYLLKLDDRVSLEANLRLKVLDEHAALHNEPDFLLREELKEVSHYHNILTHLGSRSKAPREIEKDTGIDSRALAYYLGQLGQLGYIERSFPLAPGKANRLEVRYQIRDPLLRFWFRFVFPHQSSIYQLGPERAFDRLIKPHLDAFFGYGFEQLCRQTLPALYEKRGVHTAYEIGEYWSRACQIDLVSIRQDHWIDFGECKWGSHRNASRELDAKIRDYPVPGEVTVGKWLFTHHPLKNAPSGFECVELEELARASLRHDSEPPSLRFVPAAKGIR